MPAILRDLDDTCESRPSDVTFLYGIDPLAEPVPGKIGEWSLAKYSIADIMVLKTGKHGRHESNESILCVYNRKYYISYLAYNVPRCS